MNTCVCQADDCLLCEAQLYTGLDSDQVCMIRGLLGKQTFESRQVVFRQGDASDWLYVIRSGQIKLTSCGPDGHEQIIRIGVAGHMLGFNTVDDHHHTYSAETLTPVRVCTIRHRDMLRVLEQNPRVSRRLVDLLNQELAQAHLLIRVLGQKTSAEKIALFLLSLVPEPADQARMHELPLPLSRQEIADMLGLTVETVSRLMSELKRRQIIEAPRGHLRILNLKGLRACAGTALTQGTGRPALAPA
jgi:CRP/FNR family transcriptional regulator